MSSLSELLPESALTTPRAACWGGGGGGGGERGREGQGYSSVALSLKSHRVMGQYHCYEAVSNLNTESSLCDPVVDQLTQ